ncbi:hypothetical protein FDECE_4570 [Fusarium decemcellulare]|nr:hypothetical protein FDECE_4570 [Fusarium decemcellulare]
MPRGTAKRRTGCEQCKRRKVGCDEKKPTCSRCLARGETCTGNFSWDPWQVERPWLWCDSLPTAPSPLENEALRHWYDSACLNMAILRPPANPLSHQVSTWLRHSKALRHALESAAEAHRRYYAPDQLAAALQMRGLAISSLQGEIASLERASSSRRGVLQRTILLSSLILCVSSNWIDSAYKDAGIEFLLGAHNVAAALADTEPKDPFAFYILGFFLYFYAFWSFLVPLQRQPQTPWSIVRIMRSHPYNAYVHPVTGIATTLCPLIAEVGQYYRRVVETRTVTPAVHESLEKSLREWNPPTTADYQIQLVELAHGYRSVAIIMLHQAKAIVTELDDAEKSMLTGTLLSVMETVRHLPDADPLLNWLGPLLVIAGSELPATLGEEREVVERMSNRLISWTRVPTYQKGLDLIREVWRLRDNGSKISWLELMVQQGLALTIG